MLDEVELSEVRRTGIGFEDGEFDAEARCVAVGVRDFTGQVAGASIQTLQDKAQQVREAAAVLSHELGFSPLSASPRIMASKRPRLISMLFFASLSYRHKVS